MNILLKSATIIDEKSKHHRLVKDILIENGIITKIANNIKNTQKYRELQLENLHVYLYHLISPLQSKYRL